MVYEQEGKRRIFFHDLFGRWQWTLGNEHGNTVDHAEQSFATYCSCVKDAKARGFRTARSGRSELRIATVTHPALRIPE